MSFRGVGCFMLLPVLVGIACEVAVLWKLGQFLRVQYKRSIDRIIVKDIKKTFIETTSNKVPNNRMYTNIRTVTPKNQSLPRSIYFLQLLQCKVKFYAQPFRDCIYLTWSAHFVKLHNRFTHLLGVNESLHDTTL